MTKPIKTMLTWAITSGSTRFQRQPKLNLSGNLYVSTSDADGKAIVNVSNVNPTGGVTSSVGGLTIKNEVRSMFAKTGTIQIGESVTLTLPFSASSITDIKSSGFIRDTSGNSVFINDLLTQVDSETDVTGAILFNNNTEKIVNGSSLSASLNAEAGKLDLVLSSSSGSGYGYTIVAERTYINEPTPTAVSPFAVHGASYHWDIRHNTTVVSGADNSLSGNLQNWIDIIGSAELRNQETLATLPDYHFDHVDPWTHGGHHYLQMTGSEITVMSGNNPGVLTLLSSSHTVCIVAETKIATVAGSWFSFGITSSNTDYVDYGQNVGGNPSQDARTAAGGLNNNTDSSTDIHLTSSYVIYTHDPGVTFATKTNGGTIDSKALNANQALVDAGRYQTGLLVRRSAGGRNCSDKIGHIVLFPSVITGSTLASVESILGTLT